MNPKYPLNPAGSTVSQETISPALTQYAVASVAIADTVLILAEHYLSTQLHVLQDFHAAVSAWISHNEMLAQKASCEIHDIPKAQYAPSNKRSNRRRSVSLDEQKLNSIVSSLSADKEDAINFLRSPSQPLSAVRRVRSLNDDTTREKKRPTKAEKRLNTPQTVVEETPPPITSLKPSVAEISIVQPEPAILADVKKPEQVNAVLKPVFDPITQSIRLEHFYDVLDQLRQAKPNIEVSEPDNELDRVLKSFDRFFEQEKPFKRYADINKVLLNQLAPQQQLNELLEKVESEIRTLESKLSAIQEADSGNLEHLQDQVKLSSLIEKSFSEAEKISKKLANSLPASHQISEGYSALSSLFHELMQAHFVANAKNQVTLTTQQQTEAKYPSSNTQAAQISASLSGSTWLSIIKPSVSASFGLSRNMTVSKDTDGDVDIWVSNNASLGLGASLSNLTSTISGSLQGNLEYSQGRTYLQARDINNIMKMFVMNQARHGSLLSKGPLSHYNPENLERGAFNRALIGSLSKQVEHHFGLKGFSDAIQLAYPTVAMLLETKDWFLKPHQQTEPLHPLGAEMTEHQFGPAPKNPLLYIAPMSAPAAASKGATALPREIVNYSKQASVSFSANVTTPTLLSGALPSLSTQVSLSGSFQESGYHLERLHEAAAHMALHPSVIKSYPKIFELIFNLSLNFISKNDNAAAMILSHQFTKELEHIHGQQTNPQQQEIDFDHTLYGVPDETYIPIAIMHSISSPSIEKLDRMTQFATEWTKSYRTFIAAAEVLSARKLNRSASFNSLRAQETEQVSARNIVLREAFASQPNQNDTQRFPQSSRALIAQAYDAYSLATGHLGVHLGIMNREFARQHQNQSPLPEALRQSLDQANQAYAELKHHLDAFHVPLDVEFLLRNSSVGALGKVLQTQKTASTKLSFGPTDIKLDSEVELPDTTGKMTVSSNPSIDSASFNLTYTKKEVKHHGNLSRLGIYHDFRFEISQQMVSGFSLTNSMIDSLATKLGYLAQTAGQVEKQEAQSLIQSLKSAIRSMSFNPLSPATGSLFHLLFHRYPDSPSGQTYANKLQASRWAENERNSQHFKGTVPTSLLGSASVSLKLQGDRLVTRTAKKFLGSDLNGHMMLLPDIIPPQKHEVEDIAQVLETEKTIREKLFGGTGLQELMRDYEEFLNKNSDPERPRTGFDFYEEPRFTVYAHNMRVLDHYAPGREIKHILDRSPKEPLVHGYQFESDEVKTLIFNQLLPKLEACHDLDSRVAFATGDGKPLMQAYLGIIQHYNELNLAGYQMNYPRQLRHAKSYNSTEFIPKLLDQLDLNELAS